MAGTITVGELLSDPTSNNKITIGSGTTLDLMNGAGSVTGAGKVLQSVFSYTDTEVVQAVTVSRIQIGLSATITPESTTSLIDLSALIYAFRGGSGGFGAYVYRNGVDITPWLQQNNTPSTTGSFTHYGISAARVRAPIQWVFAQLGTGVAETYDIRVDVITSAHLFQTNDSTPTTAGTASTIRLMEIEV